MATPLQQEQQKRTKTGLQLFQEWRQKVAAPRGQKVSRSKK